MRRGEDNRLWILGKYKVTDKLEPFTLLDFAEEELARVEFELKCSLINTDFDYKNTPDIDISGISSAWTPGKGT